LIAMQCVKMNLHAADFHAGAGDESAERRDNVSTRMLIERLQHEHALGQDGGQHHDDHFAPITGIKHFSGGLSMLFVVLYKVPNDQNALYGNVRYSALACLRMGMSESASFQSIKKSS